MRYEPSQNTGNCDDLVIAGGPNKRRKKLALSAHRYSKKRLAKRRLQLIKAKKEQKAALEAAQQAAAENPPPMPAFNKQQCDIENNVVREETCETEEDIAGSISVIFNVLDGTYIIKDENIDGNKQQLCPLLQGSNVASSEVKAETLTSLSSLQSEKMQCDELFTVPVEQPLYYIKKMENDAEMDCGKLKAVPVGNLYYMKKIEDADEDEKMGCNTQFTYLNKIEDAEQLGCKKLEPSPVKEEDYPLVVEKVSKIEEKVPFRSDKLCIVDMGYMFDQIKAASNHSNGSICSIEDLEIVTLTKSGLKNTLVINCAMCNYKFNIHSIPPDYKRMDINHGAALGTLATGGGYAQMEQFLAAINVSTMSARTYSQFSEYVEDALTRAAEIEMVAAAEEEKKLAIERGDVLPCGIPFIPVIADGSWMKRSYGTGRFDSPAGCGVIIGLYSQKVLFLGVRNKNCSMCQYAARKNTPTRNHKCHKNWGTTEPSTKMESDAILEGFKTSLATRGLIYSTLIADGDSSSYRRILDCDPYPGMVRVTKIECTNHLMRNFCKKMRELLKKTGRSKLKKTVEASITKMRTAIICAAKFRRNEKVPSLQQSENLKMDIKNVPSHIFGEHKECQKIGYFCKGFTRGQEENIVPALIELGVYQRIQEILQPLLNHTESLLLNKTNNIVESFNSLVAKYIGAKRLNFSNRGSYSARCCAAVVQFNTKELFSRVHKVMKKEPSSVIRGMEKRKMKENANRKERASIASATSRHVRKLIFTEDDPDYGPNALQPDVEQLPAVQFEIEVESERCESQSCSQTESLTECVGDGDGDGDVEMNNEDDLTYQMLTAVDECYL